MGSTNESTFQRLRMKTFRKDYRQLYSAKDMLGTGDKIQAQLTTLNSSAETNPVLAIAESTVQIDLQMRQRMMQLLQE